MTKNKALDVIEVIGKTALSVLPVGGALVNTVYDVVKENALSRRQEEWKKTLEERLSKVEETLENIGNNELFATVLIKATEIAMKTAKEEKRLYLANAVVNTTSLDLNEEKLIVFLDLLDKYTISHIKIVNFFFKPSRFEGVSSSSYMMGSPKTPLFDIYPELNNDLFNKIYNDLYTDGMVNTKDLNCIMTGAGMIAKRTTPLGDEFLNFIIDKNS